MKKKYNLDGFTLIEITVSIAMLSFISVVVIKLFLASTNINEKAHEIDMATIILTNEIETILSNSSSENISKDYTKNGDDFFKKIYFDENFDITKYGKYEMKVNIKKENHKLYDINCNFVKGENNILNIHTKHLFKNEPTE